MKFVGRVLLFCCVVVGGTPKYPEAVTPVQGVEFECYLGTWFGMRSRDWAIGSNAIWKRFRQPSLFVTMAE